MFSGNETVDWNKVVEHKLYMAFENAIHGKDYITEKVFRNSYLMGAVPVVLGATKSDYEAVMKQFCLLISLFMQKILKLPSN